MNPSADSPNAPNPVGVLVRIAGVAGTVLLGFAVWPLLRETPSFVGEAFRSPWRPWDLVLTLAIVAFASAFFCLLGILSTSAVWRPTRVHLAVALIFGLGTAWAWLYSTALAPGIDALFVEQFEPLVRDVVSRLCFLGAAVSMVATEWKLSAWAGYRDPQEHFWTAPNVRSGCVLLGWFLFFAIPMGLDNTLSPLKSTLEPAWHETFNRYGFLIWMAFCIAVGKLLPPLLITITGIDPESRRDRSAVLECHPPKSDPDHDAPQPTKAEK